MTDQLRCPFRLFQSDRESGTNRVTFLAVTLWRSPEDAPILVAARLAVNPRLNRLRDAYNRLRKSAERLSKRGEYAGARHPSFTTGDCEE